MLQIGNIRFKCEAHRDFFVAMVNSLGSRNDVYHQPLFYLLGLTGETRRHYGDIYDFDSHGIQLEGLYCDWQTGTTTRLTRLAFNLFNGWGEEGQEIQSSPYYLFDCSLAPYFAEAIKLRYPEFIQY